VILKEKKENQKGMIIKERESQPLNIRKKREKVMIYL